MIRPGDQPIPGYRVEAKLGRGQYGEVWRATSPGGSLVALKFLDMTGRIGWKEYRGVQRVKQIRHAHLMPIVAIWLVDSEGAVLTDDAVESLAANDQDPGNQDATETISAESLDTLAASRVPASMVIATLLGDLSLRDRLSNCLNEGLPGIPVDELIGYVHEAAKGLDHLNSAHHDWDGGQVAVQHCDIKPDNILLTGGSVVICDFGVAQVLADDGDLRATSLSGSPAYMSPESFEAKPSNASDQYSLAVTYYELRTGTLPIEEANFAAAYEKHRSGGHDFSRVPEREADVLRRATDPDPNQRFESTAAFAAALQAAAGPEPTTARASAFPVVLAAVATVVIAAMAGLGLALWPREPAALDVQLQFDLPEAKLSVNGQPHVADIKGRVAVKAPPGVPLTIEAADNPGRKDRQWTISPSELAPDARFDFDIPLTAMHYAAESRRQMQSGDMVAAVAALALAIGEDQETYAIAPEPLLRETPGLLWGSCLQVSPAGDAILTGNKDGQVRRWGLSARGLTDQPDSVDRGDSSAITNIAVAPGVVAMAHDTGAVWISQGGRSTELIPGDEGEAAVAVTRDQQWLAVAVSTDLMTKLYGWPLSVRARPSAQITLGEQPGEFPRLIGAAASTAVLATLDDEGLVWHWDVANASHQELGRQQNEVLTLCAATDGSTIAYAGEANRSGESEEAAMVDIASGRRFKLAARQSDSITATALDGAGHLLATSERISEFHETGTVILWQPDIGVGSAAEYRVLEFDRALGDVTALVVSEQAEWVAAGHNDGAVTVWRLSSQAREPVLTFGQGDRVVGVRIAADQRWLISGGADGKLRAVDLLELEVLLRACEKAGVKLSTVRDEEA
ncbi:serine/threonine-protein kinase [Pirellulales bacterium]|nr:serine/threonine-protein kinase [Pirellulales bacterium]